MTESEPPLPEHSEFYDLYFSELNDEIKRIYEIAEAARAKGFDPTTRVEIPPAHDVAARVEATLEGPLGVAKRIRELQKGRSREDVAFAVAKEIALGQLGGISDSEKAADKAVRVALAILTESITAAPLEGISEVKIHGDPNSDNQYLAIYLAGPIRAAGGTEAAVTVLVADYVRQVLRLPALRSTNEEVERALEEVELYGRNVHLQYPINQDFIRFAASHMPIMLTGEPTEEFEVSANRDLDRIKTNRVRGGSVLVLNDGIVGRAAKLARIVDRIKMPGWEWLSELAEKTSKAKAQTSDDSAEIKLKPKSDYLADVIGGRPVFSHPSKVGGFRLRYGRSRNTGLAGVGIHPATMILVNEFLATGTHIRTERPGKGSIVAPVDSIEGPVVLLKDGTVKQVFTVEEATKLAGQVERILYLGDILVALGEFLENNHPLVPSGYCEEWWSHDLEHALASLKEDGVDKTLSEIGISRVHLQLIIDSPLSNIPPPAMAVQMSEKLGIPLHPRYLFRWTALGTDEAIALRKWILSNQKSPGKGNLVLPYDPQYKRLLERIALPHTVHSNKTAIEIASDLVTALYAQLGTRNAKPKGKTTLDLMSSVATVPLRDRLGFAIGARMGRPEKAEGRKMRPPVHVLFPVGRDSGSERDIARVAENVRPEPSLTSHLRYKPPFTDIPDEQAESDSVKPLAEDMPQRLSFPSTKRDRTSSASDFEEQTGSISVELVTRFCFRCNSITYESRCPICGSHTEVQRYCSHENCGLPVSDSADMCPRRHDPNLIRFTRKTTINFEDLLNRIKSEIGEPQTYNVRGVLGLTNKMKIPEYLGKGVLRAKHDVYCYRDGTARFDVTDAPLTHFTPREIGVSVPRLQRLGYLNDIDGNPLVSEDQILELKVQDLVVPENCADYLMRVAAFVDDSLEKIYGLERYYNLKSSDDLVGKLVIGLAPHTSAGIIGRILGFTEASVCYAHPYWHAAKRRNCDGDEDAIILVLDALLNFSKLYLPVGRGGFMDAPLVLSVILNPREVDDESHNIEVCSRYPAAFYETVAQAKHPKTVESIVDIVARRLGTMFQYEGFRFTHGTSSIHAGPRNTRYKTLGSMAEKLEAQLQLAKLIDAVDSADVAERVLSHHFLRDIRGNLRAYSTQKIQCLTCHTIYRRIPLVGTIGKKRVVATDDADEQDENGLQFLVCRKLRDDGTECGGQLSLTVRQKNISKYLEVAENMIRDYGLDEYFQQRLRLIKTSLDSLFVSEQTSLTDFFDV